jgi:hypothetical protein
MVDGTLRSFAQALIDSGFFTNVIVGWMEIVVGSVRADTAFWRESYVTDDIRERLVLLRLEIDSAVEIYAALLASEIPPTRSVWECNV